VYFVQLSLCFHATSVGLDSAQKVDGWTDVDVIITIPMGKLGPLGRIWDLEGFNT
jgi:hypothetical protein